MSFLLPFQYYEMSYGLNVEMHKQVGDTLNRLIHEIFSSFWNFGKH